MWGGVRKGRISTSWNFVAHELVSLSHRRITGVPLIKGVHHASHAAIHSAGIWDLRMEYE